MKMLNCSECGLTITDTQEACPKCHISTRDITREVEEEQVEEVHPGTKEIKPGKRKKGLKKKTEVAVMSKTNEKTDHTDDPKKVKGDMIAAVVEAEALAVIEEEKLANEAGNLCEACMAPVDVGQNFCQLCEASVIASPESVAFIISKYDEDVNKWIAAVGYIVFFLPFLLGFHRKSKFVKYHAKQATILFISSTILFLVLVVFRNILDGLFTASPMPNANEIYTTIDISWRHGTGILFQYYLIGMIYALHLMPFAFMITGFINSVQGEQKPLPLMGRLLKSEKAIK